MLQVFGGSSLCYLPFRARLFYDKSLGIRISDLGFGVSRPGLAYGWLSKLWSLFGPLL